MNVHPTKNVSIGIDPYPHKQKSEPSYGHIAPLVEPPPALDWLPQRLPRGPVPALLGAPAAEADLGELAPSPGAMTQSQQDGKIFWRFFFFYKCTKSSRWVG